MIYVATTQFNYPDISYFADGNSIDEALDKFIKGDLVHHMRALHRAGKADKDVVEIRVYTQREPRDDDSDEHGWYLDKHCKTVMHNVFEMLMEIEEEEEPDMRE